jgi:hypothetical protein
MTIPQNDFMEKKKRILSIYRKNIEKDGNMPKFMLLVKNEETNEEKWVEIEAINKWKAILKYDCPSGCYIDACDTIQEYERYMRMYKR